MLHLRVLHLRVLHLRVLHLRVLHLRVLSDHKRRASPCKFIRLRAPRGTPRSDGSAAMVRAATVCARALWCKAARSCTVLEIYLK
jgi:hypothetical protein